MSDQQGDAPSDPQAELEAYLDEHGTWDAARARFATTSEDVDETKRLEALAALDVLERELGPSWPCDAMFVENGPGAFLGNGAGWTARHVVVTAGEFELFKDDDAWLDIVAKLRKPTVGDSPAALFQVRVAALARQRGLIATLEPPTGTGRKRSDIRVRGDSPTSDDEYYVECTENQAIPDVILQASDRGRRLWPFDLLARPIQVRVDALAQLSDVEIDEAQRALENLYDEVERSGTPQLLTLAGLLDAWAAPTGHAEIPTLVTTYGEPGLYLTPIEYDPLQRLLATMRRKLDQMRPGAANVTAIRPTRFLREVPMDRLRASITIASGGALARCVEPESFCQPG